MKLKKELLQRAAHILTFTRVSDMRDRDTSINRVRSPIIALLLDLNDLLADKTYKHIVQHPVVT